jgi:hypothetical protein
LAFIIVVRIVARDIVRVVAGVVTEGNEVYHHYFVRIVVGTVRAHLNARGPHLPSRQGNNHASPWQASLDSTNMALARVYGFLPQADEEPTSSMER